MKIISEHISAMQYVGHSKFDWFMSLNNSTNLIEHLKFHKCNVIIGQQQGLVPDPDFSSFRASFVKIIWKNLNLHQNYMTVPDLINLSYYAQLPAYYVICVHLCALRVLASRTLFRFYVHHIDHVHKFNLNIRHFTLTL